MNRSCICRLLIYFCSDFHLIEEEKKNTQVIPLKPPHLFEGKNYKFYFALHP